MAGNRLTEKARLRVLCTDEKHHAAVTAIKTQPGQDIITVAAGEQAVVESLVMALLCEGGQYWTRPLGVGGCRPSASSITINVGGYTMLSRGRRFAFAEQAIQSLLPVCEPTQVTGVPGLRVHVDEVDDHLLPLRSVLGEAELILHSPAVMDWNKLLRRNEKATRKHQGRPLWNEPSPHRMEREPSATFRQYHAGRRGLGWLGSLLLRRIAVFGQSTAYSTRSWITGSRWHFELTSISQYGGKPAAADARRYHHEFIGLLCQPRVGLPVKVSRDDCRCDAPPYKYSDEVDCTVRLLPTDPALTGAVYLKFRQYPRNVASLRETLTEIDANQDWLDRVLPAAAADRDNK